MRTFLHILTNLKTGVEKTLTASPADWADFSVRSFRSLKYNGVFSSDGLSQRFPRVGNRSIDHVGYYFITDAYASDGTKAQMKYERKILDPYTRNYIDDYVGMLDFNPDSGWSFTPDWWEIKTIDSSKSSKLITRDEINYNIFSLESTDGVTVPDFTNPYKEGTYNKVDIYLKSEVDGAIDGGGLNLLVGDELKIIFMKLSNTYNTNEVGDSLDFNTEEYTEDGVIDPPDLTIYNNSRDYTTTIAGIAVSGVINTSYSVDAIGSWIADWYMGFKSYDADDVLHDNNLFPIMSRIGAGITEGVIGTRLTHQIFLDIDVPVGGRLEFGVYAQINGPDCSLSCSFTYADNPTLSKTVISEFVFYEKNKGWPTGNARGLMVHEVAERLVQLETGETDTDKLIYAPILGNADSEFVNYTGSGELSLEHLTNGFQLRGFTDRAINVSFSDLFKSLNAQRPIGAYYDKVNDWLYIDGIEHFYLAEYSPEHLGTIEDDLKTYAHKDSYFNNMKAGYPKTEYDQFNGANEVNTEAEYSTDALTKTNKDISSPYYTDTVNITIARSANAEKEFSKDTKQDELIFITRLDSSYETIQGGGVLFKGEGFQGIDEYYNLNKTPRQNLQRHQVTTDAQFFKDTNNAMQFTKSAKDVNISYYDAALGKRVNEFDNIEKRDGLVEAYSIDVLFYPEVYEFTGRYTYKIRKAIEANPHQIQRFYADGVEKYGYILEVDGGIYTQKGKYKLLRVNPNRLP